jgi:formylglycine-generating enzyme required for sulfatase activity
VTLKNFELDVTEVTVAAYQTCVRAGRCTRPAGTGPACNAGQPGREQHPINCVNFDQAEAFCQWAGKRLPTEEEWEYAARSSGGRKYPWGYVSPRSLVCWGGEGIMLGRPDRSSTCAVGSYPSGDSPFGLHDMAGNVAEWTATESCRSEQGRKVCDGTLRVQRGGHWANSAPETMRTTYREATPVGASGVDLGFRCARSP